MADILFIITFIILIIYDIFFMDMIIFMRYYRLYLLLEMRYTTWAKSHEHGQYQDSFSGGARGIVVIFVGNGYGDTSSNPGRDWLHFT